jgi:hypothetical protein
VQSTYSACTLDATEEHVAFTLRAPKTGTLKKIGWRTHTFSTSPAPSGYSLYVAVETVADSVGVPVAATRAGATLYAAGAESAELTSLLASTIYFTPINGTSGISVTKDDLIAVTFRLTAISGGSISIGAYQYGGGTFPLALSSATTRESYTYYNNGTANIWPEPVLTLEYDGEFVPSMSAIPIGVLAGIAWNSGTNPDRRGIKFKVGGLDQTICGVYLQADIDSDADLIMYDYDEYTVISGFPITIDKDKRSSTSVGYYYIPFPSDVTLVKDQYYRLVLLPKSATNIQITSCVPASDDTIAGITAYREGANGIYTTFNGVPNSGSHSWTDDTTKRVSINPVLNGVVLPSGGGGRPEFRGCNL